MVKCDLCLSPGSRRGQCRRSRSRGTARQTPTSWLSSRPDRASCRGQVSAPSLAAPPGPWSRGGERGRLELRKLEASRMFLKPWAWPCSHFTCACLGLLLEKAPEGSIGHTETGQGGGWPRCPCPAWQSCSPRSRSSAPLVACPQSPLPSAQPSPNRKG